VAFTLRSGVLATLFDFITSILRSILIY